MSKGFASDGSVSRSRFGPDSGSWWPLIYTLPISLWVNITKCHWCYSLQWLFGHSHRFKFLPVHNRYQYGMGRLQWNVFIYTFIHGLQRTFSIVPVLFSDATLRPTFQIIFYNPTSRYGRNSILQLHAFLIMMSPWLCVMPVFYLMIQHSHNSQSRLISNGMVQTV